ncbi:hypothetical protein U1Q18_049947, partial [Sarracenia purpurea var. burkii]
LERKAMSPSIYHYAPTDTTSEDQLTLSLYLKLSSARQQILVPCPDLRLGNRFGHRWTRVACALAHRDALPNLRFGF